MKTRVIELPPMSTPMARVVNSGSKRPISSFWDDCRQALWLAVPMASAWLATEVIFAPTEGDGAGSVWFFVAAWFVLDLAVRGLRKLFARHR
jgi:hypothetical protein